LVQRRGDWAGLQPVQAPPRCTKCNSLPIAILLYNGPLLCGFQVSIKRFNDIIIMIMCEGGPYIGTVVIVELTVGYKMTM